LASEKYLDYHTALADGFKIFHPEIRQKMYHFTNYGYAMEAAFHFNPEHPTSLLYEKHGDDYKLIGVMYTAPKRLTEDQLDERVPLSVAQWHEHVNFCRPPADRRAEMLSPHPQFGLRGSITTQEACDAAGGTFMPVVFNWMVHVYPFEKDPSEHLVGRAPARRCRLMNAARALRPAKSVERIDHRMISDCESRFVVPHFPK
jgi:hypothetical protein